MEPKSKTHSEIRDRLGVLPNFFRLAPEVPSVGTNLWEFAKFGYIENPLPGLFKERLFVSLSRFCEVRYCISRHVGFLIGLGRPAGDADATPQTVEDVVALLQRSLPHGAELEPSLALLEASGSTSSDARIEPGTPLEVAVFDCAAHVFLQTTQAGSCLQALTRFFDPSALQHLLVFLTFVRTAHFWTVVHPELEVERDISELLTLHEALADCVVKGAPQPENEALRTLLKERESLRRERQLRKELERTNAQLREERERLQVTLASIGDAVVTTDTDGRIANMNAVAEELTGWTIDEATGVSLDSVFRIVGETTRKPIENPATQALTEGSTSGPSNRALLIAKDGTERVIEDSAAPIRDPEGRILGCVLIFRDVSERRAEEGAAQLLAAIVDSSDDAILSKGLDGRIQTWNAAAERLFGYTADEAVGSHIRMLIPPGLVTEEETVVARIKAGERIEHFDTVRLRRDGQGVEVAETISPVKDAEGRVVGVSKMARDITDRRRVEQSLALSARKLAEADRRKDQFIAILAHELRNPLSPIRSCMQVLKASGNGDAEVLAIMDRQVNQMVRLIDDLLDISRITSGKLELRKDRVEFHDVVRRALESVQPTLDREQHSVVLSLPEEPVVLNADAARLTQVLSNLLINAAKYSPARSRITLRALADDESLHVTVTDEGIGIEADKIDVIFEMFKQIEGPAHEMHGLGIGLTMARELVELHDGKLTARSEGPGRGSTFEIVLPLVPLPAHAAPQRRAEAGETPGLKVLVVDDSHDSAVALAFLLEHRGCEVRTAFDGPGAIEAAREFLPALVFLDIGMPGMSGLEAAEHIRREASGREVTLVALSGWGQAKDRERSRQAGFDEHLIKPADLDALDRIVSQVAAKSAGSALPVYRMSRR